MTSDGMGMKLMHMPTTGDVRLFDGRCAALAPARAGSVVQWLRETTCR